MFCKTSKTDSANCEVSMNLIDTALKQYNLSRFYALFSGGHDSLTATHIASQHDAFTGVIHIDTGTGLPETRQFVEDTCREQDWSLHIFTPQMAITAGYVAATYEDLIVRYGLPGAPQHNNMYRYLKERPLRLAKAMLAPGGKWLLITGVRSQESQRRMGHVKPIREDHSTIWCAPIHDWSALECSAYIRQHDLKRNPVKDTMHISGECFCGCFTSPEELRMLEIFYPAQAERIEQWQQLAREAGHSGNKARWGSKDLIPQEQLELFPLCHFCRG